jgi:hypothetical protein
VAYQANVVPVRDNENKRTRNASVSTNSPNCARNWLICSCVLLPCYLSLTMSIAGGGSPPALWSSTCVGVLVLCSLPAHRFGFCGALMLTPWCLIWLVVSFQPFKGPEKYSPHAFGLSYYGNGVSRGVTEGLAWTSIKMWNDN